MPTIDTASGTIWYADHRDPTVHRPPTLFIHGAGANHQDWPAELRRMPEANAILPDLPGHGKSGGAGRDSVSAYAGDIIALMDALQIEQAVVAGHSMGGAIAQMLAIHFPRRILGLILVGTAAKLTVNPALLTGLQSDFKQTVELVVKWEWAKDANEQMKRLGLQRLMETDPAVAYNDYLACSAFDVRDRLGRIKAPALVIGGTADKMTPFHESQFLAQNITDARLVTVEGGGHMMALEQPLVVASAVQAWLSDL